MLKRTVGRPASYSANREFFGEPKTVDKEGKSTVKRNSNSSKSLKWYDSRDRHFFFISLAIVTLLLLINVAASLIGNHSH